jgi:membrane protein insertase Oxa1/YidC/SpoIIIJ
VPQYSLYILTKTRCSSTNTACYTDSSVSRVHSNMVQLLPASSYSYSLSLLCEQSALHLRQRVPRLILPLSFTTSDFEVKKKVLSPLCSESSTATRSSRNKFNSLRITPTEQFGTLYSYSGGAWFKSRKGHRLYWGVSWISSILLSKFWYSTLFTAITVSFQILRNSYSHSTLHRHRQHR